MTDINPQPPTARRRRGEVVHGRLAGLIAGSSVGLVVGLALGIPLSDEDVSFHVTLVLVLACLGGLVGALAGFVGGLALKGLRPASTVVASLGTGLTVAATVAGVLSLIGGGAGFVGFGSVIAGVLAAAVAPFIRRKVG